VVTQAMATVVTQAMATVVTRAMAMVVTRAMATVVTQAMAGVVIPTEVGNRNKLKGPVTNENKLSYVTGPPTTPHNLFR
jgi:nitrate reductase cytochrome c-type subunit